MKIVAFIPYWFGYNNINEVKKLGGRYLINYTLEQLNDCDIIDEVVIYSSDERIMEFVEEKEFMRFEKRPTFLDSKEIKIEQIIEEFLKTSDADVVVLIHPNSPFLSKVTILECIDNVLSNKFDSSFIAYKFNKLAWFKNKPLNYKITENTPHLAEVDPVILELSSLYVFRKEMFLNTHRRIGENPFIKFIDHFEGHDINNKEDFEMAELIVNSGMYPKAN
ncbi:hypothetical protein KKG81_11810 [bacterium]|jgi:CMP-N-acetylneuraminic acid synthetase|nr:hypothetical protein [bacterium]